MPAMVHHFATAVSLPLKRELLALTEPHLDFDRAGGDWLRQFDWAIREWYARTHSNPYAHSPQATLDKLAAGLSRPVFTVQVANWRASRNDIFDWLTEQYAQLGIGAPDERLRVKANWTQKALRARLNGGAYVSPPEGGRHPLPVGTLHPREYYSDVKRHVAALRRFTDNTISL